jgi:hypothetical protein
MFLDSLILDGYGLYVWPAFLFTFFSFLYLYSNTKKEFEKTEKVFLSEFTLYVPVRDKAKKEKKSISATTVFYSH